MKQEFKSIHDFCGIGNQIILGNEKVLVEESVLFWSQDCFLTELKVKDIRGNIRIQPVNMLDKEIITHTDEQTSLIRTVEDLIKVRLMESDKSSLFVYKDEDISYKFELLASQIQGVAKSESSPRIYVNEQLFLASNCAVVSSMSGEGILVYCLDDI